MTRTVRTHHSARAAPRAPPFPACLPTHHDLFPLGVGCHAGASVRRHPAHAMSIADARAAPDAAVEDITKMSVPLSKEQKLTQRMQRKAESARVARLRKKEYVTGLEDQISDLKAQLAAVKEANKTSSANPKAASPAAAPTTTATTTPNGGGGSERLEVHGCARPSYPHSTLVQAARPSRAAR